MLSQFGSNDPVSFTLNFSTPLETFSLTRARLIAGPSGIVHPGWKAVALSADGQELDSVSEALTASFSDVPAATHPLKGAGIRAVRIDSDNQHFAAFNAVLLDDLVLKPAAASR